MHATIGHRNCTHGVRVCLESNDLQLLQVTMILEGFLLKFYVLFSSFFFCWSSLYWSSLSSCICGSQFLLLFLTDGFQKYRYTVWLFSFVIMFFWFPGCWIVQASGPCSKDCKNSTSPSFPELLFLQSLEQGLIIRLITAIVNKLLEATMEIATSASLLR